MAVGEVVKAEDVRKSDDGDGAMERAGMQLHTKSTPGRFRCNGVQYMLH